MLRIYVFLTLLFLVATNALAQQEGSHDHHSHDKQQMDKQHKTVEVPAAFRSQLTAVAMEYLALKDALVADNDSLAAKKSEALSNALNGFEMNQLQGKMQENWKGQLKALKAGSAMVSKANDISARRSHFNHLSEALIDALTMYGLQEATLYVQHCPMANNNKGGNWLSDSKEIRNPYFGDMMLKCGSVTETIAKK